MKKTLAIPIILLVCIVFLTACASKGTQGRVSNELELDVSAGEEISNYDDHGWHGDGSTCIVFRFEDDTVLEEIRSNSDWKAFPLDETVQALVYGVSDETSVIGPFLHDNDGKSLVPEIQNGYYLLIDRQAEEDKAIGADIMQRSSFNFTLGLYDADTNTLYFCQLDT